MVSAVSNSPSVLQSQQQQSRSKSPTATTPQLAFQQSVDQYLQNTTSGVGGGVGANPSQTLSGNMMSSLLQMQQ